MIRKKHSKELNRTKFLISISNKLKDREVVHLIQLSRGVVIPASAADQTHNFLDLVAAMEAHKMLDEDMKDWNVLCDIFEVIKRKDLSKQIKEFAKEFHKSTIERTMSLCPNPFFPISTTNRDSAIEAESKENSVVRKEILQNGDYADLAKGIMGSGTDVQIETLKSSAGWKILSNPGVIQSCLKHENIVKVLKICRDYNPPWVVLEWTANGDLQQFVRSGQGHDLTSTNLIDIVSQIAEGMKFLEKKRIVHCNLKASNVFVSADLVAKIGGFCLARHIGDAKVCDLEEEITPPLRWSAPEVILYRQVTKTSDVWSFGVLVVELFAKGDVPYQGIEKRDLIQKLRSGYHPEKPPDCPCSLYRLIMSCWLDGHYRPSFEKLLSALKDYKDTNDYSESPALWKEPSVVPCTRLMSLDTKRALFANKDPSSYETSINESEEEVVSLIDRSTKVCISESISCDLPEWTNEINLKRDSINLKELIGSGEFGLVWKAGLLPTDTNVAVKQITVPLEEPSQFLAEAKMMMKFNHPHLLKLIGICVDQPPLYIVTELMPTGSMLNYLRTEPEIPLRRLLYYAVQVADAMTYVEKMNCIHRDIAARNVFMKDACTVKLGDFGLSRSLSSSYYQASTDFRFPVRWTSPESIQHKKFSIKSDVWSFGILLVEIITRGEMPYPEMNNEEVLANVKQGYIHPRPEVCPDDVYGVMTSCWGSEERRPPFGELYKTLKALRERASKC